MLVSPPSSRLSPLTLIAGIFARSFDVRPKPLVRWICRLKLGTVIVSLPLMHEQGERPDIGLAHDQKPDECSRVRRNGRIRSAESQPSWPYHLVAVDATTIDCASIILPMTPPELLAAAISTGFNAELLGRDASAGRRTARSMTCREPVSATPSQPIIVPKNGYSMPVSARTPVPVSHQCLRSASRNPMAIMQAIVSSE